MGDLVAWAARLAGEKWAGVLPRRWAHVQGVGRGARVAVPLFSVDDGELLVGAALLHDIGYAPDLASTGFHALDGARYLRRVGGPDRLVNLVAHHSCATLEGSCEDCLASWPSSRTRELLFATRCGGLT
jgi:putative nucleotidyltransferase with HDIG domain